MTHIPKKIFPDFLKDAIIEIRYDSDIDDTLIPGLLSDKLSSLGFNYVSGNQSNSVVRNIEPTFYNDTVTCRLRPGSFSFNCKGKYPGWEAYLLSIKKVITAILDNKQISNRFTRVGLRYVNLFKETNLFDVIHSSFRLKLDGRKNEKTTIKTEILEKDYKVILNLGNGYSLHELHTITEVSLIDVDVIKERLNIKSENELIDTIEELHKIELDLFFLEVLDKKFKEKLDAIY